MQESQTVSDPVVLSVISHHSLFVDKSNSLNSLFRRKGVRLAGEYHFLKSDDISCGSTEPIAFILGWDTLQRLFDERFYVDIEEALRTLFNSAKIIYFHRNTSGSFVLFCECPLSLLPQKVILTSFRGPSWLSTLPL